MISLCTECQTHQNKQPKEPLLEPETSTMPWQIDATDLFHHNNSEFLLVSDTYSRFPFIRKLHKTTATSVINKLKEIFSEHGIPEILKSDNVPQYACREFEDFTNEYGFKHIIISPHFAQSNGFIERSVQIVKKILSKTTDVSKALLILCSTPNDHNIPSPPRLMYNRDLNINIPKLSTNTNLKHIKHKDINQTTNNIPETIQEKAWDLWKLKNLCTFDTRSPPAGCLDMSYTREQNQEATKSGMNLTLNVPSAAIELISDHEPRQRYRLSQTASRTISSRRLSPHSWWHTAMHDTTDNWYTRTPSDIAISHPWRVHHEEEIYVPPSPNVISRPRRTIKPPNRFDL